ncbi:MAG: hypothetical protein JWQ47_2515, partial [Glaciihabitans sp.]|nr:hypothetical protein [Glaciihabitans sp.]
MAAGQAERGPPEPPDSAAAEQAERGQVERRGRGLPVPQPVAASAEELAEELAEAVVPPRAVPPAATSYFAEKRDAPTEYRSGRPSFFVGNQPFALPLPLPLPLPPPNPCGAAVPSEMVVAAMSPLLPACPIAVTVSPAVSALTEDLADFVTAVDEVVVTVTSLPVDVFKTTE